MSGNLRLFVLHGQDTKVIIAAPTQAEAIAHFERRFDEPNYHCREMNIAADHIQTLYIVSDRDKRIFLGSNGAVPYL